MRQLAYREALREALREEMLRDPRVFIMGEEVGLYGGAYAVTKGLIDEFGPDRVRDTPISEEAIVGAGVGAAMTGTRPVVELMYIDFAPLAMDAIVNQMAKIRYMFGGRAKVPMVLRTQGGTGRSSAAQHSQSLEAWFMHVPGLRVVMPATPADAKGLLKTAIRSDDPVIFIEHKALYATKGEVPEGEYLVPFGKLNKVREGRDITIITYSRMVLYAMEAAQQLAQEGIDAEVLDLRTLNPLDLTGILESVHKTRKAIVVEEDCKTAGVGAEIVALIMEHAFDSLDAPVTRVAGLDVPIPCAPVLERASIPSVEDIVQQARRVVGGEI